MGSNSSWVREVVIVTLSSTVCNKIQEFKEIFKYKHVWAYFGCFFLLDLELVYLVFCLS